MSNGSQKYSSFADIKALEAEKKRLIKILEQVELKVKQLSELGIKLDSSGNVAKASKELTTYQAQLRELEKLQKSYATIEAKMNLLRSKENEQLQVQKLALKELANAQTLRLKIRAAEEGSIEKMNLQFQKATKIINGLTAAQRESARGQDLIKSTGRLSEEINNLQKRAGNFKSNVGRYAESLGNGFELVRREIIRLNSEMNQKQSTGDTRGAENTRRSIESLNNVIKISHNENLTYEQSVRQIIRAYQNLAAQGGVSNEFLNDFKKFAAQAKDSARDMREEIQALSSDTRGLDLATQTITGMVDAYQVYAGVSQLAGDSNEEVEKSIQKLMAVQSVANGIRSIGNQLTQKGTALNIGYAWAQKQVALMTNSSAAATARFGAALKLVGIGLLITLVAKAADALNIFGSSNKGAEEEVNNLTKAIEDQQEAIQNLSQTYNREGQLRRERLKQQGADAEALYSDELNQKAKEINDLKAIEQTARQERDEFEKQADLTLAQARKKLNKKITKEYFENYKEQADLRNKKVRESTKAVLDKEMEMELFKEEHKTKLYQDTQEERKRIAEKQAEIDKAYAEKEIEAALELRKVKLQIKADSLTSMYGDDNLLYSTTQKISSAELFADTQKKLLKEQYDYDLKYKANTTSQKLLLEELYSRDVLKVEDDLRKTITHLQVLASQNAFAEIRSMTEQFYSEQQALHEQNIEKSTKAFEKEQSINDANRDTELRLIQEFLRTGVISKEDYEKSKARIEASYQKSSLESQIKYYEEQTKLLEAAGQDATALQAAIAKAKLDLSAGVTAETLKNIDLEKAAIDSLKEKYEELSDTLKETFINVIGSIYETKKNQIQDEINDIERLKAAEIDRINSSSDADEKKAAKIKVIEAKAAADKERLEQRKRKLDQQKAVFEKSTKVFEITTDNIVAINKIKLQAAAAPLPLKAYYSAQIPLAIAIGAAQLLSVLATPIPKYWTGTNYSKEGFAEVAEKGSELGIDATGKVTYYDKPTVTWLNKGTKILPADVTKKILSAETGVTSVINSMGITDERIVEQLEKLNKKKSDVSLFVKNETDITTTTWWERNMKY